MEGTGAARAWAAERADPTASAPHNSATIARMLGEYDPRPVLGIEADVRVTVDGVPWRAYFDATREGGLVERKWTNGEERPWWGSDPIERYWESVQLRTYEVIGAELGLERMELEIAWLKDGTARRYTRDIAHWRVRDWRGVMRFWLDTATRWRESAEPQDGMWPWRPVMSDWDGERSRWYHDQLATLGTFDALLGALHRRPPE